MATSKAKTEPKDELVAEPQTTATGAPVVPIGGKGTALRGAEGGAINRRADQPDIDESVPNRTLTAKHSGNDVIASSQTMDDIENVQEPTAGQAGERTTIVPFAGERVAIEVTDAEKQQHEARVASNRAATRAAKQPAKD